jgi:hypothetical protein
MRLPISMADLVPPSARQPALDQITETATAETLRIEDFGASHLPG